MAGLFQNNKMTFLIWLTNLSEQDQISKIYLKANIPVLF